jgi:hypothetical protein
LECVEPTPYQHSQHSRKNKVQRVSKTLTNTLAYVGEQEFFGVNMLGAFSACNWGVPLEEDVDDDGKRLLIKVFGSLFTFGSSCFVADDSLCKKKVIRDKGVGRGLERTI